MRVIAYQGSFALNVDTSASFSLLIALLLLFFFFCPPTLSLVYPFFFQLLAS